jgi:hypothetical protein
LCSRLSALKLIARWTGLKEFSDAQKLLRHRLAWSVFTQTIHADTRPSCVLSKMFQFLPLPLRTIFFVFPEIEKLQQLSENEI